MIAEVREKLPDLDKIYRTGRVLDSTEVTEPKSQSEKKLKHKVVNRPIFLLLLC